MVRTIDYRRKQNGFDAGVVGDGSCTCCTSSHCKNSAAPPAPAAPVATGENSAAPPAPVTSAKIVLHHLHLLHL